MPLFVLQKKGKECCSETAIGFHRVTNEEQYKMHYLMYSLRNDKT
jgi:hypothetical protein